MHYRMVTVVIFNIADTEIRCLYYASHEGRCTMMILLFHISNPSLPCWRPLPFEYQFLSHRPPTSLVFLWVSGRGPPSHTQPCRKKVLIGWPLRREERMLALLMLLGGTGVWARNRTEER